MKLALMTLSGFFVEEDKILASLFDEGLDDLHLCKPAAESMLTERLLMLLHDDYCARTTIHSLYRLKEEYGLRGIHLPSVLAETPMGYKGRVGRTCTAIDELKDAKRHSDYVFLARTFGPDAAFTTAELEDAAWRGLIDRRVYALGGVTADTITTARELGFGGAVVDEDLWLRFDRHNERDFKHLMAHFDKLRRLAG